MHLVKLSFCYDFAFKQGFADAFACVHACSRAREMEIEQSKLFLERWVMFAGTWTPEQRNRLRYRAVTVTQEIRFSRQSENTKKTDIALGSATKALNFR